MVNINQNKNWNNVFLRDVTVSLLETINQKVYWYNHFSSGTKKIEVPFYYSLTGDERYLLDAFIDDMPEKRVELNHDPVPRGHLTLNSWGIKSNEFANPDIWLKTVEEEDDKLKTELSKAVAIPLVLKFSLTVKVASELDLHKFFDSWLETLWAYKEFDFEHSSLRIEGMLLMPDDEDVQIPRDIDMENDNKITSTLSLEVHTYKPVFHESLKIPLAKRVKWKNYIWKLSGSGGENDAGKENKYPQE